jgi:MFS family permease
LSDRRGRRPLLIGGALLAAAAVAAHAVAPNLAVLIGLRLVLGVAEAFFFVAAFAALADIAPPGRAGEALSFNSLALYLGIALGPFLGEWLLEAGGFTLAWLGGAAIAVAAGGLAVVIGETAPPREADAAPTPLFHPAAFGPGLAIFAGTAAMGGFLAFVALHARDVGMDGAGPALLLFGLVVVACRIAFSRLPDRVQPTRLIASALLIAAVGMGLVSLVDSAVGLLLGAGLLGVGMALLTPAVFAATLGRVPPGERGSAMATVSIFIDLAFGAGPILVGAVAGASSITAGFASVAVVAALGAVAVAVRFRPMPAPVTES